jgi:hypothetical protein
MILISLILVSCTNQDDRISYPENIRQSDELVLWDEVDDATSYSIKINNTVYTITDTSYSLENLPNGTYDIRVRSHKDDLLSYFSPVLRVTLNRDYQGFEFVTLVDHTIYFPEIDGVISYALYHGDTVLTTFQTDSIDLSSLTLSSNQLYAFRIAAIYPTTDKVYSEIIFYHTYVDLDIFVETTFDHTLIDNLDIQLSSQVEIDYLLYNNEVIPTSQYAFNDNVLTLVHDAFHPTEEGTHYIYILTTSGFITIKINVINQSNPRISSSDHVIYTGEDLNFTFELNGGNFVGLSGNTITQDEYQFIDQTLIIKSSYVERMLLDNPTRQTIILVYQLSKNSNITMGFIFINIPQE